MQTAGFAAKYNVIDLGALGGQGSRALDINNFGKVIGHYHTSSGLQRAFLYDGGTMQDIGTLPGAPGSYATAISDIGQVIGQSLGGSGDGFLYSDGVVREFSPKPVNSSFLTPTDINGNGTVVGHYTISGRRLSFVYSNGDLQTLTNDYQYTNAAGDELTGPAYEWVATTINDNGQIAGYVRRSINDNIHAFLYSGDKLLNIETITGLTGSEAIAINTYGQVLGQYYESALGSPIPFLYSNGVMQTLDLLPQSNVRAINDFAQVVGSFNPGGAGVAHAFLYDGQTSIDLNLLISPSSGWELITAYGINNAGQIVGLGINPAGEGHAFLLTVPEPAASFLLVLGGLAIVIYQFRARRHR